MVLNTAKHVVRNWIIFELIASSTKCYQVNKQFKREPELDGCDCPVNETVFEIIDVSSKRECIKICSDRPDCRGVFLAGQSSSILCHGCSQVYNDTLYLGRLTDSIYFKVCTPKCTFDFQWNSSHYVITALLENFTIGQDACHAWGGYIVVIETAEENNFLKEAAKKNGEDLMIGLLRGPNGNVYWEATKTAPEFTDWGKGEPANNQSCTQLWSSVGYAWDDCGCDSPKKYLCERRQ